MIEHNPEKRTPSAWSRNCLEILKGLNRNYRKNKEVKGKFIEFIREDDSGIIISQNFIRIQDTYYLGFALLFTTKATTALYHPLLAGSRFDHNVTIWRQFDRDLGLFHKDPECPNGIWSFGSWRKNTMERLYRGFALPEEYLLPFYLERLKKGKNRLVNLFGRAHELLKDCPITTDTTAEKIAALVGVDYDIVTKFREEAFALDA